MEQVNNTEKQDNYRVQFGRLKKASGCGFYLEAVFIEYAIIEDRFCAILSYEGNQIRPKTEKEFISAKRKLNKIKKLSERKNSTIRI